MVRVVFFLVVLLSGGFKSNSQCVDFDLVAGACINENISVVTPNGLDTLSPIWNFCPGNLGNIPIGNLERNLSGSLILDLALKKTELGYIGFYLDRIDDIIYRVEILSNSTQITNLGNPEGLLNNPDKLVLHYEDSNWYALVTNDQTSNNLVLLNFGSSLNNIPVATNLGNLGGTLNRPRGIDLTFNEQNDLVLLLTNRGNGRLVFANFGASIETNPTEIIVTTASVPDAQVLLDLSAIYFCDQWFAFSVSLNTGVVHRFELSANPGESLNISSFTTGLENLSQIELIYDGLLWRGFVNASDGLHRLDFIDGLQNQPEIIDLTSTGLLNNVGITMLSDSLGYLVNSNTSNLIELSFSSECSVSSDKSLGSDPTHVSYQSSGEKYISLGLNDKFGRIYSDIDTILISNEIAPDIEFDTNNRCISNLSAFHTINNDWSSFFWDFNNDGTIDSNEENPSYQFPAVGTYTVRLDVDDGTCGNFTTQEITIYDEPPLPDFETTSLLCGSQDIVFDNLTPDGSYDGPMEYSWNFDGQGTSTERNPSFTFGSGGQKTVTLTAGIPGCYNEIQQVIELEPGPTSQFSAGTVCQGEPLSFTNQSANASAYL